MTTRFYLTNEGLDCQQNSLLLAKSFTDGKRDERRRLLNYLKARAASLIRKSKQKSSGLKDGAARLDELKEQAVVLLKAEEQAEFFSYIINL